MDTKAVIERLTEHAEECMGIAKEAREKEPRISWFFFRLHETLESVIGILKEKAKTAEIELDGGGASWWYVCSECHGRVDDTDHYCRHCGRRLE